MIEAILKPFDFILQMPIEQQCEFSIGLSFAGFCIAAFLRESCKDHHIRYAARALGAAAFFAVAAFAVHATQQVEQLEQELFVKEGKKISSGSVVTLIGKRGHKIEVNNNGLRRTCDEFRKRYGRLGGGDSLYSTATERTAAGSVGRVGIDGSRHDGLVSPRHVLAWAERFANGLIGHDGDSAGSEFSGQVEGKDF